MKQVLKKTIPSNYRLCYSEGEIQEAVERLSPSIDSWVLKMQSETGKDVIALGVLRGAVLFFSDLLRKIPTSLEFSFCKSTNYSADNQLTTNGSINFLSETEFNGRAVLIIDDICDSGTTLRELKKELLAKDTAAIKSVVLIRRESSPLEDVDWAGHIFQGNEWLVGYGMEDSNKYASLPAVYCIEPAKK